VLKDSCTVEAFNSGSSTLDLGSQPSYAGDRIVPNIGSVTITCSSMAYGICVSGGSNYIAGVTRRLKDTAIPANYLVYDLQNASNSISVGDNGCNVFAGIGADTAVWAAPIGGAVSVGPPRVVGIAGTGSSQSFSMNAIVTIPTNSLPGTYSDNGVQLTIVW
jgi:spore coat protein U-like protein